MSVFLALCGLYKPQHEERKIKVCLMEFDENFLSNGRKDSIAEPNFQE
jgi:hypothetical protein